MAYTSRSTPSPPCCGPCVTPFQVYDESCSDITEKRLLVMITSARKIRRKLELVALLHDYLDFEAAIAWRDGEPVFIRTSPLSPKH